MASTTTIKELRNMQISDLIKEIKSQRTLVAKLRLGVKMQKEKDTSKYTREKKQLSRMMTVLTEKRAEELQKAIADATVPAPELTAKAK